MNIAKGIMGIYKITSPSGKVYIGSAVDIRVRCLRYMRYSCKDQTRIYRSLLKYKSENHIFEIQEECEFDKLNERERYYQELYDCTGINGLNCVLVPTDEKRQVFSEETRRRLSIANSGRVVSEENKRKASERMKGTKWSKETHDKVVELRTGVSNPKNGRRVINTLTGEVHDSVVDLAKSTGKTYCSLFYQLSKNLDIGYKFEDIVEPQIEHRCGRQKVQHIPTGLIFSSISEACKHFNLDLKYTSASLAKNSSKNEFKYLERENAPKKKSHAKKVIHIESGIIFNTMREAELYFNYNKGYVKNHIRGTKECKKKFKVLDNDK